MSQINTSLHVDGKISTGQYLNMSNGRKILLSLSSEKIKKKLLRVDFDAEELPGFKVSGTNWLPAEVFARICFTFDNMGHTQSQALVPETTFYPKNM